MSHQYISSPTFTHLTNLIYSDKKKNLKFKTVWHWHKNTQIIGTEINPHTQGQLVYDKGRENIQWRTDYLQ